MIILIILLGFSITVFIVIGFIKLRGPNYNYDEYSIDEVPQESLWRWD